MKIRPFDIGLEGIQNWRADDEVHLPHERGATSAFLPVHRALDEILKRPSLDERLTKLVQPERIDPDLLLPAALSETRRRAKRRFSEAAAKHASRKRGLFEAAAALLGGDIELDDAVSEAMAALFRG